MASTRAFGVLNNQNLLSGNQPAGKSFQSSKNGETRTAAFALKDLTNKNQRSTPFQPSGKAKSSIAGGGGSVPQDTKILKAKANEIFQKISKETTTTRKATVPQRKPKPNDYYTPQSAEYGWGQASYLRDDLLEQMLEVPVAYEMTRKPLKKPAARSDLLDLPDLLDVAWNDSRPGTPLNFPKPLDLPAEDFPLVDIPDLEFMF